jgi:hypothetical protein
MQMNLEPTPLYELCIFFSFIYKIVYEYIQYTHGSVLGY